MRLEGRGATGGDMIKKFDKKDEESGTGLSGGAEGAGGRAQGRAWRHGPEGRDR